MDNQNKRKRSQNWDTSQKILLRQLIEEKISIVENKSVDTNTTKSKRESWAEILMDSNKISQTKRYINQLQTQWKALKMKAKVSQSAYKKSRNATGGGPQPKSPDSEQEKLISLIPHEFEVDENEFDCDFSSTMIQKENVSPEAAETSWSKNKFVNENISQEYDEVEFLDQENTGIVSPPCHLTPSPKKKRPKKMKMKDEDFKNDLFQASMENKLFEKKCMEEEHELKMRLLLEQISQVEQERKQSAELHELKKKIKRMKLMSVLSGSG